MIESLLQPDWDAPDNVVAWSTTRVGGVSVGPYGALNLGAHVDDDPAAVAENRRRLHSELQLPCEPVWLEQVHGTEIVDLNDALQGMTKPVIADAASASKPEQICVVMTADCLPLLLCNRSGTRVAAVHAGWRGLASGIIEHAVARFEDDPANILAWAGPTISRKHFEIGDEVRVQLGGPAEAYSPARQAGKCYADLYALAAHRLSDCGVLNYSHAEACTYADQQRFFSHRRDQITGRLASLIYLR